MIRTVDARIFVRFLSSGRTQPALCVCEGADAARIDVVVKRADRCDAGSASLAREAIAACLAGDLGLPVSEPLWVNVPAGLIPDEGGRGEDSQGDSIAFGSTHVGHQFSTWPAGQPIGNGEQQIAAEVLIFDAVIQNYDRRPTNPNCLVRGVDIRLIDHEATFIYGRDAGVIGWLAPWLPGGMQALVDAGGHIFLSSLREGAIDFDRIRASWQRITDAKLLEYRAAVHPSLAADPAVMAQVDRALSLIRDARDQIDGCILETRRVIS